MAPEGYHHVRGHIRRNPRPRMRKTSGWVVAAVVVGAVWLWGHGTSSASTGTAPTHPSSTASVAANH
ncbi:hypothetical protein DN069_20895 [Streptacidiphilus pinicola]|uniref:Uncharacterized protein n=1 Tax=Streptacidiphilus pinicola TaxID=2219663 RepID=A0A2X0J4R8_9ACTN|nr:hypothetical protein [Streptacidiphilus pinicola]RAG82368.1 hypothetical protein DN069_28055 [Streptacidiphilus pinicola]RAG83713.1 hypothetical protein DN069_20895 [Streptacidiphilus pinicola]